MEELCKSLWLVIVLILIVGGEARLKANFYSSTCPNVESIVRQAVIAKTSETPLAIAATVRLFFHDCFVEGCDASVLIASPNNDAEKDSDDDLSLAGDGFDTVIRAKAAVEAQCPGIVSCADILAIAAIDVVVIAGGPGYKIQTGRRDGLVSQKSQVSGHLPEPTFNLNQLNTMFAKNNLSQTDMIALSGCHTIGFSHCKRFMNRIIPVFDPTIDPSYAQQLKQTCSPNPDVNSVVPLDPVTSQTFDNVYFKNLVAGKGLLSSDQVLYTDPASRPTVVDFANNPDNFNRAFARAMRRLGRVGVKTGNQGEIRRDCTRFNS